MESPQRINIGLMGLGVVGGGVARALMSQKESLSRKAGCPLILTKVLVRDREKPRSWSVTQEILTTNPQEILGDPDVQVVVEVMGGEEPAGEFLKEALFPHYSATLCWMNSIGSSPGASTPSFVTPTM